FEGLCGIPPCTSRSLWFAITTNSTEDTDQQRKIAQRNLTWLELEFSQARFQPPHAAAPRPNSRWRKCALLLRIPRRCGPRRVCLCCADSRETFRREAHERRLRPQHRL